MPAAQHCSPTHIHIHIYTYIHIYAPDAGCPALLPYTDVAEGEARLGLHAAVQLMPLHHVDDAAVQRVLKGEGP